MRYLSCFCALCAVSLFAAPVPIGHWRFAGSDGKIVKDLSPAGNDATIMSGSMRDGRVNFGGTTYAEVGERAAIRDGMTIIVWVNPSLVAGQRLIGKPHPKPTWTTPMPGIYFSERGTAVFAFWAKDGSKDGSRCVIEGRTAVRAKSWTSIAVSCSGGKACLYVNGVEDGNSTYKGDIDYPDTPLYIGRIKAGDKYFRGTYGEAVLYDRGLSESDIMAFINETKASYPQSAMAGPERRSVAVAVKRSPDDSEWKDYKTYTLDLLDGYTRAGETVQYDRFGGLASRKATATGFFHAKKDGDRWWLIDPDGGYFIHMGIVSVGPNDGGPTVKTNFLKKFTSKEDWADKTTAMLRESGFNGAGAWSDVETLRAAKTKLVYTVLVNFMVDFAKTKNLNAPEVGRSGFVKDCMPVFDPEFPAFCGTYAERLAALKDDPWLLGIFSDNELRTPDISMYLTLDPSDPAQKPNYDAAKEWLASRTQKKDPGKGDITEDIRNEFMGYAFDRYFGAVSAAIRKVDPNHIYFGSRLHSRQKNHPYIWHAAKKYVDVVAVNYYGVWGPDLEQVRDWYEWSGKPILISEWYAKGDDMGFPNMTGEGWLVKTQLDRGLYYQHYVLGLLESKTCVGWHWYKYTDNDTNNVNADPSNRDANKGIVQVTYEPYMTVLDKMREVNREVYPLIDFFDRKK